MKKGLVLISCSHSKEQGGDSEYKEHFLSNHISEKTYSKLIKTRKIVFDLIRFGCLRDIEHEEGDRGIRKENKSLINGPDFGGKDNSPVYLPAKKRYIGRFYVELDDSDWENLQKNGYICLILSGLYGFITPEDTIQNYDCHLSDRILYRNKESLCNIQNFNSLQDLVINKKVNTLRELWTDVLTEIIKELVDRNEVQFIVDILSEENYQNAILWEKIQNVKTLHRVFSKKAGPDILSDLSMFFKKDIAPCPAGDFLEKFPIGKPIKRDYFDKNTTLFFEGEIDEIKSGVQREGKRQYDGKLRDIFGDKIWENFSTQEKDLLRNTEERYKKFKNRDSFLIGSIIMDYWSILEKKRRQFVKAIFELCNPPYEFELCNAKFNTNDILQNAGKTESLLKDIINTSIPVHFVPLLQKISKGELQELINTFKPLREIRNKYKSFEDTGKEIESDLNEFRDKIGSVISMFLNFETRIRKKQ